MHLLGFLLVALTAVSCCQAEPACEVSESEKYAYIFCTNLTDSTPLTAALATTEKPLNKLKITNSKFVLKRQVLDNPRFVDIVQLVLSDNWWSSFNSEPIQVLTNLDHFILSDNNLTTLTANTVGGLTRLTRLRLNKNEIETIDPSAFQSLTKLNYLALESNKISAIPPGLFNGLPLQELQLGGNLFTRIDEDTFKGLVNLTTLGLAHNRIRTIDSRAFQNLHVLVMVQLKNNKLENLDSRLFENNPIFSLDLNGNSLGNLANFPLNSTSLNALDLKYCNITSIPDDYFKNVPNLFALSLARNKISSIQPGVFSPLTNLAILQLEGNSLESLNVASFQQIHTLLTSPPRSVQLPLFIEATPGVQAKKPTVALDGNPWDCSSPDMVELKAWCEQHNINFGQVFTCDSVEITSKD